MPHTVRIGAGDASILWAGLEPSADRKRVVRVSNGSAEEVGTATEHVRLFDDGDLAVIERTQILDSPVLGNRVDTTVVVRDTFAPIRYRSVVGTQRVEVAYQAGTAHTRRIRNGIVADARSVDLDGEVFDAHSLELILRLLPLHRGYRVVLPAFDANVEGLMEATVAVTGSEEIDDGAGTVTPVWSVTLSWQGHQQRYWLSMEGSGIVRQTARLPDGAMIAFVR